MPNQSQYLGVNKRRIAAAIDSSGTLDSNNERDRQVIYRNGPNAKSTNNVQGANYLDHQMRQNMAFNSAKNSDKKSFVID